jgi:signal transduction histidine kinase
LEKLPVIAESPPGRAIESAQPVVLSDITDATIHAMLTEPSHATAARSLGPRSVISVPLFAHGQTLGAMTFALTRPDVRYGPSQIALAEELARRAAVAIEHAGLYKAAQEAIQVRDEFMSIASHELRTPVTALLLSAQALGRSGGPVTPDRIQRTCTSLERQAIRLTSLVDEMLSVGRIHLGRLDLRLKDVDLVAVVGNTLDELAPSISQAHCSVDVRASTPVIGHWDEDKLGQVVTNILSNALKFGPGKPIEISIDAVGERARLAITDHGIGITADALPHIFEKFSRAVSTRHYGGFGLGLYIVSNIVEALGGSVCAESVPGSFTTFTVELPIQSATCHTPNGRKRGPSITALE